MKFIKKIFFGLFIFISILYLFIVVSPKVFEGFYPFGIKTAIILTGSMEPTLSVNDFVIVKKTNEIKINDIISFKQNGLNKEVLHRVIKVDNNEIVTKGDANNVEDSPINISQVTGVYVTKIKYIGNIISFLTKPAGISLMCTIFVIILIFPNKKEE